jgi:hypothetical protein
MFPSKKSGQKPTQIRGTTPRTNATKTSMKKTTKFATPDLLNKPGKIHKV